MCGKHAQLSLIRLNWVKKLTLLLKVVETCFWAQNDRSIEVYIGTYNNIKLYDLPFSRKTLKTVFGNRDCENRNSASEGRRDFILGSK